MPTRIKRPAQPPAPKPPHPVIAAVKGSRWLYVLVAVLVLAPCYWQPHIQAGDLSSHIYNAWLAQLIAKGQLPGLRIAVQTTNVLFDLMLAGLFGALGPDWAQRIAASLAALVFISGAFAWARAVSGRMPWQILPSIAILAYGWVFHMGFFNFYLSLGLAFWALALAWEPNPRRLAAAAAILAIAYVAHALPVVWAIGLAAYKLVAERLPHRMRGYLLGGVLLAMVVAHLIVAGRMASNWSARQITLISGLDQVWVFDNKYYLLMMVLLLFWVMLFLNLVRSSDARTVLASMPFQLSLISAAAVFMVPTAIMFPGYRHGLVYIAERMSLAVGICACALLASARPRRFEVAAMTGIAVLFFAFLYRDERVLNSFEDNMRSTLAGLPAGQRAISAIDDPGLRVNALAHAIDRACIGRCFSYANYEPSTAQFRVRADGPNPYVAGSYQDSWLMQVGMYVVEEHDLPLYQVDVDANGQMMLRTLRAGVACGSTKWNVLGNLL